jgi:predicted DNA-binding transcriptional regulator AlpA
MTSAEVGRVFSIAERTTRQWHDEGRLPPAIKVSRKTLRWRRSDIEAFIANGGVPQQTEADPA